MIKNRILIGTLVFLLAMSLAAPMSFAFRYPKVGILTCGDLWETFAPDGIYVSYTESKTDVKANFEVIRIGNMERAWTTPTCMYPAGDKFHLPWGQGLHMMEYSNIENFNNYTTDADPRAKHYVFGFAMPKVKGYDPTASNADQSGGVPWTDANRTSQIYTASQPTNLGVNVKIRARANTLNEANMNDWIAVEVELTNTGEQDIDCDGVLERTGHKIEALAMGIRTEHIGMIGNTVSGNRWSNNFTNTRFSGYDGTPDPEGNPWDVHVMFATNIDQSIIDANGYAPDGARKVGYRYAATYPIYFDIWNGWTWIAVKQGDMDGGYNAPDKKTIYDSHPVGVGTQRGWFSSSNRGFGNAGKSAYVDFLTATGTWYEDGGKSWSGDALAAVKPDPNWFDATQAYTAGDPLSFVNIVKPEGQRGQPMGDMKYLRSWLQNWERNFPQTSPKIPTADEWTDGGTAPTTHNFDGDMMVGIGPFSMEVGETMTAVVVEYVGYRLKGARNALNAARWAYERDWQIPTPPPMPDMKVLPIQTEEGQFSNRIIWDSKAEAASDFAGYKIYRVTAVPKTDYRKFGTRLLDLYHHQGPNDIGISDDELEARYCQPINPNNSAPADYNLLWDPGPQGPWRLVAYITKAQLANYANTGDQAATYPYEWLDSGSEISFGRTYWYYVAAFDNETGDMAGVHYTSLESSKDNYNGRYGTWYGCYSWAYAAGEYPTYSLVDQKFLGANFVLKPARVDLNALLSGEAKIQVKPNPYKVASPYDVGQEHKVQFYNLTADTRITILDLSGQIMQVLEYEGQDPTDGSVFWDMFTKDGPEAPSGLYIWIAEYPKGKQKGYLAIMR